MPYELKKAEFNQVLELYEASDLLCPVPHGPVHQQQGAHVEGGGPGPVQLQVPSGSLNLPVQADSQDPEAKHQHPQAAQVSGDVAGPPGEAGGITGGASIFSGSDTGRDPDTGVASRCTGAPLTAFPVT